MSQNVGTSAGAVLSGVQTGTTAFSGSGFAECQESCDLTGWSGNWGVVTVEASLAGTGPASFDITLMRQSMGQKQVDMGDIGQHTASRWGAANACVAWANVGDDPPLDEYDYIAHFTVQGMGGAPWWRRRHGHARGQRRRVA